ncbi:MAG: hypothetical protein ACRDIB_04010, partial [Ardenticatenaceae bacterium]
MFEWEVREALLAEAEERADAERRTGRAARRFGLGVLLVSGVVLALLLRWRLGEQQAIMREDLGNFIVNEERLRLFGLREEVDELVVPDAPGAWRAGFASTFAATGETRRVALEVQETVLDGREAIATVRLDGRTQVRAYRLVAGKWRRAPLPVEAWGEEQELAAPGGITLRYRQRDALFAEAVAADLPALRDQVEMWGGLFPPREITISPREFAGPVIALAPERIALNSPLVLSADWTLDSAPVVRLALAALFFEEATFYPERSRDDPPAPLAASLPGAARIAGAARTLPTLR